jgi:hypothetical protein
MYKLIETTSFFSPDEPQVQIINFDNVGELTKQAVDDRISEYVKAIKPSPGRFYLHINAMGAGEYWSANKNGDWFPEENLKQYYKTFETSPAHVFRHHINKDPAKAIGKVLFAIYNERMHRVELIAEVDAKLGSDIEDRIAMGDYPFTSMACKTPYDVCSVCGNKAHTRQEYCAHLQSGLGQVMPDGRKIMALNVGPLKFFDISIVIRPADVTSGVLQKVASEDRVVGSAEMAEACEIGETKEASHKKLADIIKEIEGTIDAASPELEKIVNRTKDLSHSIIGQLRLFDFSETLGVMAELGISPSIEFLAELIARKTLGDKGRGLGHLAAEYIKTVDAEADIPKINFEKPSRFNILIAKLLTPYLEHSSLLPEYVEKRAAMGYASFNPQGYQEPVKVEEKKPHTGTDLAKTLLTIGGVALLAKMYISHLINERLKNRLVNSNNFNAKIVLVKQASDYLTAFKLAKYATAKDIRDREEQKKNLEALSSSAKLVLKGTQTQTGGRLTKVIKTIQLGSKAVDKYSKDN